MLTLHKIENNIKYLHDGDGGKYSFTFNQVSDPNLSTETSLLGNVLYHNMELFSVNQD